MKLASAFKKLLTRKKMRGYYEASQILTMEERQSLIIASSVILVPLILSLIIIVLN